MLISKALILTVVVGSALGNTNTILRELIVRIHGESNSATVYFVGIDEEFLSEFVKHEVSIPITTFNADLTEDLRQFTNAIIVFQVLDASNHVSSKLLQNVIEKLQVRKFAIVAVSTLGRLNQYFSFFNEYKFTRIFGTIGNTSSYAYLPFAGNPVQQLVENGHLPEALKDLNGFTFRTTVQSDSPRTFWYTHTSGQKRIGGRAGQIFLHFLRRHNATFREIIFNNPNKFVMDVIIDATVKQEIDISSNVYFRQNSLDLSYPIQVARNVIMVPSNGYLDPIDYFQRPFQPIVWLCIGLTVIYITISKIALNSLTNSKLDIWDSFSEIYLTLLSSSSGKPIVSNYRFHLLIILFGFVFERLYGSYFQSFLTAYIKIKQYDTIKDLEENNVRVMISNVGWDHIKNGNYPKGFDRIVVPTDTSQFILQCISMRNTSFAYVIEVDRCLFLIGYQSLFRKSLFRIAQGPVLNSYLIGYLLAFHSPFKEILDDFIIEIRQTGLIQKWDSDVMYQAKADGFRMNVDADGIVEVLHKPLTVHHLKFAWQFLAIGLALSNVVFVLEWVCTNVKRLI